MNVRQLQRLQADPAEFRRHLLIDSDAGPVRLVDVMDDWQADDFAATDSGWRSCVGQRVENPALRAWIERPRGHSKTSDEAVMAAWALFASRKKLSGIAAAADKDQAGLLRDAVARLTQLNDGWLAKFLDVQRSRVVNTHTESTLEIISSDAPSSYSLTPHLCLVDEATHWQKRDLWDSLVSASAKRRDCMLTVICNAGFTGTWAWETREAVRTDPAWHFSRLDSPQASWITEDRLAEQRRLLPPKVFARLWLNRWADGSGDAIDDVDQCVTLRGPSAADRGFRYVAGLDLGISRDATALVTVGVHTGWTETHTAQPRPLTGTMAALVNTGIFEEPPRETKRTHHPGTGRLKLADVAVWKPDGVKVDLEHVEAAIVAAHERFRFDALAVDPWQAELLSQRLRRQGVPVYEVPFTGSNMQAMASAVLDGFRERNIDLFDHRELVADLKALRVVERSYGYRLESPRAANAEGTRHGDTATALGLAMLAARRFAPNGSNIAQGDLVCYPAA